MFTGAAPLAAADVELIEDAPRAVDVEAVLVPQRLRHIDIARALALGLGARLRPLWTGSELVILGAADEAPSVPWGTHSKSIGCHCRTCFATFLSWSRFALGLVLALTLVWVETSVGLALVHQVP